MQGSALNVANVLSIGRAVCGPFFIWLVATEHWALAFAVVVYAVVSDLLDGEIARRFNLASPLGGRIDHSADYLFTCCGLLAYWMFGEGLVPLALVVAQSFAFLEYAISGPIVGASFQTSRLGRYNGILYFVVVTTITSQYAFQLNWIDTVWINGFCWLLVAATCISITARLINRYQASRANARN